MKRWMILLLLVCLTMGLTGCAGEAATYEKYTMSFFHTFDTLVQIIGYAENMDVFTEVTGRAQAEFERLHRIFDAYAPYDGVNNLYTVNRDAAGGPVPAEPELIDLLLFCRDRQAQAGDLVNVAMGSVLSIWHDYRTQGEGDPENAELPPMALLEEAAQHIDFDDVVIDEEAGTVYFADPELSLDVGAVAKGYATELVAQMLLASEMPSFIIGAGGNIRAGDPPLDGRLRWGISVQSPDEPVFGDNASLDVLYFANASAVTSGDYQRYYIVDGQRYHHIISPETLMPADFLRAVTVVTEDSGWADFLSTTLFLMPYEEGRALVDSLEGVEALWVQPDGTIEMSDGMKTMARSQGASSR